MNHKFFDFGQIRTKSKVISELKNPVKDVEGLFYLGNHIMYLT